MNINIREYLADASLEINFQGEVTDHDVVICSIIAFAAVAKADEELEPEEIASIIGIIVREFDVKESEASELLQTALLLSEEKMKFERFLETLSDKFNFLQRQLLMALVWRVILSDKQIEKFEATMAVKIRTGLGLTPEEAVRARKLAEMDTISIQAMKEQLG